MMALKLFPVMVVTVGLLAGRTTSWTRVNRQRRSDDGGPLEVVVEQLSQQVASLKSQLTEQANSFNALLSTANAKIAALGTKTGEHYRFVFGLVRLVSSPFVSGWVLAGTRIPRDG